MMYNTFITSVNRKFQKVICMDALTPVYNILPQHSLITKGIFRQVSSDEFKDYMYEDNPSHNKEPFTFKICD